MKTNRTLKLITLTAAIFGFAATSFGQNSTATSETATASAKIIKPIGIEKSTNLSFGNIVVSKTANGTVTVAPGATSASYVTVAAFAGTAGAGTISSANFNVSGEPNYQYTVTMPESLTLKNIAENEMTVTLSRTPDATGTLNGSGNQVLSVGGVLSVGADQASGYYSAEFVVKVDYQ